MDEEIAEVIREYGWYVANINDAKPPFLYTIGLMQTLEHPELIMFELETQSAYALLSGLIESMRQGKRYSDNGVHAVELGGEIHQIGFRQVHSTQQPLYLGFAMGYMRSISRIGELMAIQVFWPDRHGKFPFDVGCEQGVYNLQPRLDIGLTPREVREFARRFE